MLAKMLACTPNNRIKFGNAALVNNLGLSLIIVSFSIASAAVLDSLALRIDDADFKTPDLVPPPIASGISGRRCT